MDNNPQDFDSWRRSMNTPTFALEPKGTALVVIDMQYATACRNTGLGKTVKERGQEDNSDYRFNRIENLVIPNTIRLLDFFREHRLRIIYVTRGSETGDYSDIFPQKRTALMATRNARGNREHEILDEIKPHPGECVINKLAAASAFSASNIEAALPAMAVEHLLFTGVTTNGCVESTARDAVDRGYRCVIVEDACAAWVKAFHDNTLRYFGMMLGRVETTQNVIEELSGALREPVLQGT